MKPHAILISDHPHLRLLIAIVAGLALTVDSAAQPDRGPANDTPPWKRYLTGEAAAQVEKWEQEIADLQSKGRFAEAVGPALRAVELRARLQGADHWQAADAQRDVEDLRKIAAMPEEGRRAVASARESQTRALAARKQARYIEAERLDRSALEQRRRWLGDDHRAAAESCVWLAVDLGWQGRVAEAEPFMRKGLAIRVKVLGESDPYTAMSYRDLGAVLHLQGESTAAEPLCRKALAIHLKVLGPDHQATAISYDGVASSLHSQGKHAEAEPFYRGALRIRIKALGKEHPVTVGSYLGLATNLDHQGRYTDAEPLFREALAIRLKALGEEHADTAQSYNWLGQNLNMQGNYAEAGPLYRKALAIRLRLLGESHPDTATSYGNLATMLDEQGKHVEAEPFHQKALAIRRQTLGENHPETATSYNNLAFNVDMRGKYAEAELLYRKALSIRLKAQGEDHPDTATSYNNVAYSLTNQVRHAEAEPLFRKALASHLKVLGAGHPETARNYNNVAYNLRCQGKYAEAEPLYRKALAVHLKTFGEDHPLTALTYANIASNLRGQGNYAQAGPLDRKALAIRLKVLGEDHPDTAQSYDDLAYDLLGAQGKAAESEPLLRKALALRLKAFGEDHPSTAASYNSVACILRDQGKYAEAEPLFRKALAIRLRVLGQDTSDAAGSHNALAYNLNAQGKLAEAISHWTAAAAIVERIRGAWSVSGLDRSAAAGGSPVLALAAALARAGQPREAWARWEAGLARGLLDDVSARQLRPLKPEQRSREAELARRLQRLDEGIARMTALAHRTQEQDARLEQIRSQQSALRGQWVELQNSLDHQYQACAGRPSPLADIQKALPADAALVGWLDQVGRHWACLVRTTGEPVWVQTPGHGPDGTCTPEDHRRDWECQRAIAAREPGWRDLTAMVARQRFGPLLPHLRGVRHLVVLPSEGLAAIPVEVLVAALPADAPRPIVSYAPSGSLFARLIAVRPRQPSPLRLLALADPAFPRPAPSQSAPTPPDSGLEILAVAPHGTGDIFDLKVGDVLLEYNRKPLRNLNDLAIVPAGNKAIRVPVKLWRHGEIRTLEIAPGPLGIQTSPSRPFAPVVLAQPEAATVLNSQLRGEGLAPLPGTRREVQAIAALFPGEQTTTLLGPDATESTVQRLAQSGALKGYRFLHLATHGQTNRSVALSSAVFLAAEPERPAAAADAALFEPAPDGQITAEQIVRTWDLDADLVVLSACESGLGRYAVGEGYLGFAQALFVKGARSLVLSLWRVDDKATSLLMTRFYRNLLGKRAGLANPMPKAEALHEAKEWLRNLTLDDVGSELAALDRGEVRPLAKASGIPAAKAGHSPRPAGVRPYEHPYYWAAFLLIGDPG